MIQNLIALIIVALMWIHTADAAIDAMELALLQPYQNKQLIRWDNISSGPLALNQQPLVENPRWNIQGIRLQPGQQSRFVLPAYESLRLYNPQRRLQANEITAYLSNATGLLTEAKLQTSTDGHSLLISPNAANTLIVHINQSSQLDEDLELAILVSHRQRLSTIAPYRNLKGLSGQWAWLTKKPLQMPELFWHLQAYHREVVEVEGPARIKLRNRLRFDTQDKQLNQDYRISYNLDDNAPAWLNFSSSPGSSHNILANAEMEILGREQHAYIEIPAGSHRLHLVSDKNLYLQVLEQIENDYLMPYLNQPPLPVQAVREQGLMQQQPLFESNSLAQAMVRDNSGKSSAISGQQQLKQAALQRMDYPAAVREANKLLGEHTSYRDLLPTVKHTQANQFDAYFFKKRLKSITNPQGNVELSAQHQADALQRLGHAQFSPIATGPEARDRYALPERYAPTKLRIIADKRNCTERRFNLQMDQQPAQSLILRCQDDVRSAEAFVTSLSETAVMTLQKQLENPEHSTLSNLFSKYRKPAVLIPVAINEITLPPEVRQLTIWSNDQQTIPLNLALQIRSAKSYQLSEKSYLAHLHALPKAQLFKLLVTGVVNNQNHINQTEQPLLNQWIPLKRFLTSQFRQYKASIADSMPVKDLAKQLQLQNLQKLAKHAEQQQQWTDALAYWTRVVEGSQNNMRDQAQLAQAAILAQLSENYLAQSLWRYLSLYAQADVAEMAKNQLLAIYKQQHDNDSIEKLAAAMFMQRPNHGNLRFLIESLIANKHYRFALLLGLTLNEVPSELMLKAAYQIQWWQTYERLLTKLPQSRQWFWAGLKAQKFGDYATALNAWKKSGSVNWLSQLQTGLTIRQQLVESQNQEISQLYHQWSQWQQRHPGDKIWQDATAYIKDAAGTDVHSVLERAVSNKASRGTQQRPVKLQVMGPAKLRFNVRVLHQQVNSKLDGWLQIIDNQKQYRYPFSNNRVVQGLVLTGEGDYLLGNLITVDFQVGQGFHQIELSSADAPVSVSINQQQAEIPLTVLAPLQIDTFTHALNSTDITGNQLKKLIQVEPSTSMAIADWGLTAQAILDLPEVENALQAEHRMVQCLALMETDKTSRMPLLFVAEKLQQRFPDNATVKALWNKISRYSQWQTVNSIVSSAGMRFIHTQGWLPGNPGFGIRKALISQTRPDQHVVFGNQRLLMVMTNLNSKTVNIEVLLDDLNFLTDSPAQLRYQIDSQEPQQIAITRSEGWKKLVLQVPTGKHQIRFSISNPVANQFLKLRFQNDDADTNVSQERSFFASTRGQPLKVYINGPAVIRIDEWQAGKIKSRYQDIASGWQMITIPPREKQKQSLLQIKQRVATDKIKPIMPRVVTRTLEAVPAPAIQIKAIPFSASVEIKVSSKPGQQSFGTWSLGTDSVRRNNVQEDSSDSGPVHYQQLRINRRYYDAFRNSYWNTQGFARIRENGKPSFGIKQSLKFQPEKWPFSVSLEATAITQQVDTEQEWLGQFKAALSQTAHLSPKTLLVPKLSWFGRYLSLSNRDVLILGRSTNNDNLLGKIDQDLFTVYKAQHTLGLSASLSVIHEPWLDTRWSAKINSVSNEDINFFIPDHVSTEVHWKQLLGDADLDAGVRVNFYQKDKDRNHSSRRHFTKLKLNWQIWTEKQDRLEVSTQYNYDIDRNEHLGMLKFTYHFSENRGYRDFKPGEINFRQIRKRQWLDDYN